MKCAHAGADGFDQHGDSPENRARIVLDILAALIEAWGPGRIGIKIAPTVQIGGFVPTMKTVHTFDHQTLLVRSG